MEYILKGSPSIAYLFITNPSCIIRWFCDEVDNTGNEFSFSWSGDVEEADLVEDIEDKLVKFVWKDRPDEFLQFKMYKTDITNETILEITDFCDEDEVEDQKEIWEENLRKFRLASGS